MKPLAMGKIQFFQTCMDNTRFLLQPDPPITDCFPLRPNTQNILLMLRPAHTETSGEDSTRERAEVVRMGRTQGDMSEGPGREVSPRSGQRVLGEGPGTMSESPEIRGLSPRRN